MEYTIKEMAEIMDIPLKTLQMRIYREQIKPIKTKGRTNYFSEETLEHFKTIHLKPRTIPDEEVITFSKQFIKELRMKGFTDTEIIKQANDIGRTKWFKKLLLQC